MGSVDLESFWQDQSFLSAFYCFHVFVALNASLILNHASPFHRFIVLYDLSRLSSLDFFHGLHLFVEIDEMLRIGVKAMIFFFWRKSILQISERDICGLKLKDVLKVENAQITQNPIYLYAFDVDARNHGQIMDYLVSGELYVLLWIAFHQLKRFVL